MQKDMYGLETKFCRLGEDIALKDGSRIEGYASVFGVCDQGRDVVMPGAYARSLARLKAEGRAVKMLWQHDPGEPIGIWDEITEDSRGLKVRGRLLSEVSRGREAAALIAAGAIDGLSIGYRTVTAQKDAGGRRLLQELDLWEVSLVTFPMLPEARVGAKGGAPGTAVSQAELRALAATLERARKMFAAGRSASGGRGENRRGERNDGE